MDERERPPLPLRDVLLRGLPLAVICAAACAVAAGVLSSREDPVYTANALVLMRVSSDPAAEPGSFTQPEGDGVATQALLVARRPVLERAAERVPGVSAGELDRAVSVSQVGETDAVRVTAEADSASQAADMSNGVAAAFVGMERQATKRRAAEALRALRRELRDLDSEARDAALGVALRQRIQDLTVVEDLGSSAPRVVERAEPPAEASSPQPRRDAAFGGIFGFVLGAGLSVLWVASRRRVRDPDEASELLGAPALATMPRRRRLFGRRRARERAEEQAWQLLHLRLGSDPDGRAPRTVAVTAVGGRFDRSRVAYGLAATAAASGRQALLVSMDPDRRALDGTARNGDGLGAVLSGDATLPEAADTVAVPSGHLDVVAGGVANGRGTDIAGSSRLGEALTEAAAAYELVVIDTPSVLDRVEALPVVSAAEATVVVVPAHADREELVALRGRLEALRAHVAGVVLGRG